MYESNEYKPNEDAQWTRAERDLDAHLERQEAKARRELAEGLLELREFTGHRIATPVASALNGWLASQRVTSDYGPQAAYTAWESAHPRPFATLAECNDAMRKPAQSAILNESEAA